MMKKIGNEEASRFQSRNGLFRICGRGNILAGSRSRCSATRKGRLWMVIAQKASTGDLLYADHIAIARQVATERCELQSEPNLPMDASPTTLVFPLYRSSAANGAQRTRISEAEARVLYCMVLGNRRLPFAVEVPTTQQYAFTGKTKMSARTDLVVYAPRPDTMPSLVRDLAVEFKAHNPRVEAIRKDLEKLLREPCEGLWFHVLRNVDSKTITVLMAKFTQAIEDLRSLWLECTHSLTVCVVVKEKGFWLYRTLVPSRDSAPDLSLEYKVSGQEVVPIDARAWNFEFLGQPTEADAAH